MRNRPNEIQAKFFSTFFGAIELIGCDIILLRMLIIMLNSYFMKLPSNPIFKFPFPT